MTHYEDKYFHVQMRGRDTKTCGHGWVNSKNICVFCGAKVCDSCGGEGFIWSPLSKHDDNIEGTHFKDQCPNPKCDRGFVV